MPTFRDDKNGLWAKFDPYELSSTQGWLRNPERVWGWYLWRHYLVATVEPNDGHRAVAAWQDHAEVSVVTQNVDDLHERAGSSPVHHLHGSLFEFRCATCGLPYTGELPEMAEPALEVEPPTCNCGGLIRPDIVWFGEPLPEEPWQHAVEATTGADMLVVVGTSSHRVPGGESARVGAGARHGRHRGQSRAHAAVRQRHDHRARVGQQGAADTAAAAARPAELEPDGRARPSTNSDTGSGAHAGKVCSIRVSVHFESRGADRLLGVAVGVAVSRQPRPDRRIDESLEPAANPAAGHMLHIAQLATGTKHESSWRRTESGSLTEHSTSEHTTASKGSSAEKFSTAAIADHDRNVCVGGRVARPSGQPILGLDRDDLRNRVRIEREVGPDARTDLEDPAGQPGQVFPAQLRGSARSRVRRSWARSGRRTGCRRCRGRGRQLSALSNVLDGVASKTRPPSAIPLSVAGWHRRRPTPPRYVRRTPPEHPVGERFGIAERQVRLGDQQRGHAVRGTPQLQGDPVASPGGQTPSSISAPTVAHMCSNAELARAASTLLLERHSPIVAIR